MPNLKNTARRILGLSTYSRLRQSLWALRTGLVPNVGLDAADAAATGEMIASRIGGARPAAIGKIGATEYRAVHQSLAVREGVRTKPKRSVANQLHILSGVFPSTDEMLMAFAEYFIGVAARMDLLVSWRGADERAFIRRYCPTASLISMVGLDPFCVGQPWTTALAGKTVLVASPFIDTMGSQYRKRALIWKGREAILPEFDLQLLRIPFSDGLVLSSHRDWFEALDRLEAELRARSFDVLLVGAGAFSLPLAVAAKEETPRSGANLYLSSEQKISLN